MDFISFLVPERIACNLDASSKKKAFETLASLLTYPAQQQDSTPIFDALINREKLGCTALGNGIAIPHARFDTQQPVAAILTLEDGIDLNAPDKKPVTTLIALLLPKDCNIAEAELLNKLIIRFANQNFVKELCSFTDPKDLISYLSEKLSPSLAAA